jgi:hypothetical protein
MRAVGMVRRLLNLLTAREWTVIGLIGFTLWLIGGIEVAIALGMIAILVKLLIVLIERATKYLDAATAAVRAKQRNFQGTESEMPNE